MIHVPDTTPYPWPWDGVVDLDRLALVVVGWDEHSRSGVARPEAAEANVERLAAAMATVITVAHRRLPPRTLPAEVTTDSNSNSKEAAPALPGFGGLAFGAEGIDGFYGSPLEAQLRRRGIDRLLLAGMGLETTVHSTLRTANDIGLECLVVVDACAPIDPDLVPQAVSMIEMSGGIFGAVGATDAVLAALTITPDPTAAVPTALIAIEESP